MGPGATADDLYRRFVAVLESGSDHVDRRRRVMLEIGAALGEHGTLPPPIAAVMDSVLRAWRAADPPDRNDLLDAKAAVWQALVAKNGDSTTIRDRVDRSLRAALSLVDLHEPDDLLDNVEWAAAMLSTDPWPQRPGHA